MSYTSHIASLLLFSFTLAGWSVAETVVTPAGLANQEGRREDANGNPRPAEPPRNEATRAQFIYHSSTFSSVTPGPIRITEINLRPDGARAVGDSQGYDNLRLVFAVTSTTPDDASTTFANNLATVISDSVVAYDQAWDRTVRNPVPAEGTRPFDFTIELTEPFDYDPSEGHLMVDWFFGLPHRLDAHTSFDSDSVWGEPPTEFPEQQGIFGLGDAIAGTGGQIVPTQFVFHPVPEPSLGYGTVWLLVGLLSHFRRKQ